MNNLQYKTKDDEIICRNSGSKVHHQAAHSYNEAWVLSTYHIANCRSDQVQNFRTILLDTKMFTRTLNVAYKHEVPLQFSAFVLVLRLHSMHCDQFQ